MNAEDRRSLWRALNDIEDWLEGGARRFRPEPDFAASGRAARSAAAAPSGGSSLELVAAEVRSCTACPLASSRKNAVPGEGSSTPLVLVVGEGPGAEEDESGRPFVGPAGQLLDKMLAAIGLDRRTNCFIANIVKCRPPRNRDPEAVERQACLGFLRRQIEALNPRAILCVGRVAAQTLLGTEEGIGALRGVLREFEGRSLIATYHPSALLRDESLKRPAWEDLKKLRDFLAGK
jgi:DNA polymerase